MSDFLKERWQHIQGEVQQAWDTLTDSDLDDIAGEWDTLVSTLQEKYSYTKAKAQAEAMQLLNRLNIIGHAEDPVRDYPVGDGVVKLVSTQWLMAHMTDENLTILDVQPNVHDYIKQHIPSAVYMNESLLRVPLKGLPAQYVPEQAVEALFRRVGLDANHPVVVYTGKGAFKGWGDGLEQTMVAYTLARFGLNQVYVLDGGLEQWITNKGPVSQVFPEVSESTFGVDVRSEYFVDYEAFKGLKDQDDVILLDARPASVYQGQGPWIKAGHIPGAINVPWKRFMHPNNPRLLKSEDEIQKVLDEHKITPEKTIICSCGTGREATNEFLLFKWYLEYPKVKIYEGSFTEWSSHPANPTVTGPNPR